MNKHGLKERNKKYKIKLKKKYKDKFQKGNRKHGRREN